MERMQGSGGAPPLSSGTSSTSLDGLVYRGGEVAEAEVCGESFAG
jgi:hypothetical protein